MSADDLKAAGNAAFKEGNYEEAVTKFTAAIEADPTNHVLYSNRSGAYAAQKDFTNALRDANKCIELKPDWAKGHSRRGAAYVGKENWAAAVKSYEAALEVEPENANAKEELTRLKNRRSSSSANNAMPNMPNMAGFPPPPARPPTTGLAPRLNLIVLLCAFFYVIPLLGPRRGLVCYRVAAGAALALQATSIFSRHALSFSALRDPAVTKSREAQVGFLCLMLMVSPPLPFAIVPFGAHALHSVATNFGSVTARLPAMLRGLVQPRLAFILTEEGSHMVMAFASISELMVLFMAPLQVAVHGFRTVVLFFFYFQYISRNYVAQNTSYGFFTQNAVASIAEKARGLFHHRYCPAPLGMVHDKAVALIASLAARVR